MRSYVKTFMVICFAGQLVAVPFAVAQGAGASTAPSAEVSRELGKIQATLDSQSKQLEKQSAKIEESEKAIGEAKSNLYVIATLLGIGIVGILSFARSYVKRRIDDITRRSSEALQKAKDEFVEQSNVSLNDRLSKHDQEVKEAVERAVLETEAKSYVYIHIATLRYQHHYDEALAAASWKGDPKVYAQFPEAVQRHLIACLTKAHSARSDGDNIKAWDWIVDLVQTNPDADNVEAMLRTAKELRHAPEALSLYDTFAPKLSAGEQARCEQFLIVIMRKAQGDSQIKARLKRLADKHRDSRDMRTQTTIAAVYRDEGLFEEADSIMRDPIKRLTGRTPHEDGWDKLFNTYIANCIDLNKPNDAVRQVKTLLASYNRPDHVFNCARVAWRLAADSPERAELFRLIKARFADGQMPERDDGTIKTSALILELEGDRVAAEKTLLQAIEDMKNNGNSAWAQDQSYFYRCALAELLLARKDQRSLDRAIEAISESAVNDRVGEARYFLSKALIQKEEFESATRQLEAAAQVRQKWIKRAKNDPDFDRLPGFDRLVRKYTSLLPME